MLSCFKGVRLWGVFSELADNEFALENVGHRRGSEEATSEVYPRAKHSRMWTAAANRAMVGKA